MNENDYPALYRSAEAASASMQEAHLTLVWVQSVLLVAAAAVGMWPGESRVIAVTAAFLFLLSLAVTIYAHTQQLQRYWYQARALAESIKTTSWLYMMAAQPYDGADATAPQLFRDTLTQLLQDNQRLGDHFAETPAVDEQLTSRMQEVRGFTVREKINFYRQFRISDQRQWYSQKAEANRSSGKLWFRILVCLYLLAVLSLLIRIATPEFKFYPSAVLAVAAGAVLTWIQLKRYGEIAAAYVLTAHEIGIIEHGLGDVVTSQQLRLFVADAENAFSREHTQWAARRRE